MGQTREVARGGGKPDSDKADIVVPERARRRDGHHLGGGVGRAGHARPVAAVARARSMKRLGPRLHHVLLNPPLKTVTISRDRIPGDVERVVTRVVAVRVRGMRSTRHGDDRVDGPRGKDHGVRAEALEAIDDLLDGHDRRPRSQDRLLLYADDAFEQHVAGAIGFLRVDDRHVRPMRRHRCELFTGERARDELDVGVDLREIRPAIAAEDRARHPGGAGRVGVRHRRVAVLFDLERPRPAAFDCVAEAVQRADAGVAAPREDELARAAAADHLVVEQVRRHADQRQIRDALPDDLVPGGKGDEVGKALERDTVARAHETRDGVGKCRERAHATSLMLQAGPRCSSRRGSSWPRTS